MQLSEEGAPGSLPHSTLRGFQAAMNSTSHKRPSLPLRAALEYLSVSGRQPDVIHLHEWQAAAAAMLFWDVYSGAMSAARLALTLHNMDCTGECSQEEFAFTGARRFLCCSDEGISFQSCVPFISSTAVCVCSHIGAVWLGAQRRACCRLRSCVHFGACGCLRLQSRKSHENTLFYDVVQ